MKRYEDFTDKIARCYEKGMPKNITFQVTEDCNLRCTYCYQTHKTKNRMTFETAKKFIDKLLSGKFENYLNLSKSYGFIFEFIGGEPLLEIELIDKITEYILSEMIRLHHPFLPVTRFSMASNGTLYFDKRVQNYFQKYHNWLSFSISIDGNKALHDACRVFPDGSGSYDLAMKAVKDWRAKGNFIGSKMTLAPANIQYASEAVISLLQNGYEDIHLNCVFEEGWTNELSKIYYEELIKIANYLLNNNIETAISVFNEDFYKPLPTEHDENWCGGDGRMIAVDWKGNIYPCLRFMPSSLGTDREPLIIGNVNDGLLKTKKQCEVNDCLKCLTRRSQSSDECFNCPVAAGCSWCTAYNYQVFGTPNKRATFICDMHKAEAKANVYFWNKYYKKYKINKNFTDYLERVSL